MGWCLVGKKRRTVWKVAPLCLFWSVWKVRNSIAFDDGMLSLQRLKAFFVFSLWSETQLFIKDGPTTLIDSLIGWVPVERGFFVHFCLGLFLGTAVRG